MLTSEISPAKKTMLGLDSMTAAKTYPTWFSGMTGYPLVVLGTCQ
jgi:hypothetical protein